MEREQLTFDIVGVGCGVATLATVLRLLKRLREDPATAQRPPPSILILDKAASIGAHTLSGAVVDSESLADLLSLEEFTALPRLATVKQESFQYLTPTGTLRVPWVPPVMQAEGYPILSLAAVTRYLATLCEKAGAEIYCGFPATELLYQGDRVIGVRLGDKGVGKDGQKRSVYQPGAEIRAGLVILGEGGCGLLAEKLIQRHKLQGHNPQTYAVGIKELIETPAQQGTAGTILHTFGYPMDSRTYGGGFVYRLSDTLVAIGLVTALDYRNPNLNPHDLFRLFKQHPAIQPLLAGGKVLEYGAKVLPEGGFHSAPGLVVDGAILVGDAGGLCNSLRLKGVHLAVQSGLAAGDALAACWQKGDFSAAALQPYPQQLHTSGPWRELAQIRNVRACFHHGLLPGMLAVGASVISGGALPPGKMSFGTDAAAMQPMATARPCPTPPAPDASAAALQLDKLSDLFFSKTHHEENQPSHLKILDPAKCKLCIQQYGAPCTRFCPAQVYVLAPEQQAIHIDFSNCLHCKTCQIKDPLQNIQWTAPEGGGGPIYSKM